MLVIERIFMSFLKKQQQNEGLKLPFTMFIHFYKENG